MNLSPLVQRSKHWFATAIAETGRITRDPAFNSRGGLTFQFANREMKSVRCAAGHSFMQPPGSESWCRCGLKVFVDTCGLGHKDESECATAQQNAYGMHIAYHAQMFSQMANKAISRL